MIYVSGFNKKTGKYAVTDTDDGATTYHTKEELLSVSKALEAAGTPINGVAGNQVNIVSMVSQVMDNDNGFKRVEKMVDELVNNWTEETCMEVARSAHFVRELKGKSYPEILEITKKHVYPESIQSAVKDASKYTNSFREVNIFNRQEVMAALAQNVCLVLQQKTNGVLTSFVCSAGLAVLDKVYAPMFFDAVYLTKQLYSYTYDAEKLRPYRHRDSVKNPNMLNVFSCSLRFRNDGVHHDKGNMVISSPFYSVNLDKIFCVYILDKPAKLGDTLKKEFQQHKNTGTYDFDFTMFKEVMRDVKAATNSFADPQNFLRYLNQSKLPNGVTLQDVMDRYTRDWGYMTHLRSTGVSFAQQS